MGALVALVLAGCALTSPSTSTAPGMSPPRPSFESWRLQHADDVAALEAYLRQHGLLDVLPLSEVLKSASSWHDCQAAAYALPPPAQWPALGSVLALVRALQAAGAVGAIEVHSGYRDEALNACAGGAARSAHRLAFALDFTPVGGDDPTPQLCAFWQRHGAAWRMGLGRYPSGRIHIDTAGHRSWGADGRSGSAVCRVEG